MSGHSFMQGEPDRRRLGLLLGAQKKNSHGTTATGEAGLARAAQASGDSEAAGSKAGSNLARAAT